MIEQSPASTPEADPIIVREATTDTGEVVPELLEALIAREKIIDRVVEDDPLTSNLEYLEELGYFDVAKQIHNLKDQNGIEP